MTEFVVPKDNNNVRVYCETLNEIRTLIQNKRREMLTAKVVLSYTSSQPHKGFTQFYLIWTFYLPPPSPSFPAPCFTAPTCCHVILSLQENEGLAGATQRFQTGEELIDGVSNWLDNLNTRLFDRELYKLVSRHEKDMKTGRYGNLMRGKNTYI